MYREAFLKRNIELWAVGISFLLHMLETCMWWISQGSRAWGMSQGIRFGILQPGSPKPSFRIILPASIGDCISAASCKLGIIHNSALQRRDAVWWESHRWKGNLLVNIQICRQWHKQEFMRHLREAGCVLSYLWVHNFQGDILRHSTWH